MSFDSDNKQLASISDIADELSHMQSKKIRKYLDWKNSGDKNPEEKISDRFKYFRKLDGLIKMRIHEFLYRRDLISIEKLSEVCKLLGMNYRVTDIKMNSIRGQHKLFEMSGDFDIVIIGTAEKIYDDVLVYIMQMMD